MKSSICTILLSESEFSFALLLVTFEPFDLEQSYIPHLKALMCGINAAEAQRCDCMFTFCYAYPKLGVLLHKMANASHSSSGTVCNLISSLINLRPKIFFSIHRYTVPEDECEAFAIL